jgi:hypothetical protein
MSTVESARPGVETFRTMDFPREKAQHFTQGEIAQWMRKLDGG